MISRRKAPKVGRNAARKVRTKPARKAMPAELPNRFQSKVDAKGFKLEIICVPALAYSARTPKIKPKADPPIARKIDVAATILVI